MLIPCLLLQILKVELFNLKFFCISGYLIKSYINTISTLAALLSYLYLSNLKYSFLVKSCIFFVPAYDI